MEELKMKQDFDDVYHSLSLEQKLLYEEKYNKLKDLLGEMAIVDVLVLTRLIFDYRNRLNFLRKVIGNEH